MARNKRRHTFTIGYGHTYISLNARADFSQIKKQMDLTSEKSSFSSPKSSYQKQATKIQQGAYIQNSPNHNHDCHNLYY